MSSRNGKSTIFTVSLLTVLLLLLRLTSANGRLATASTRQQHNSVLQQETQHNSVLQQDTQQNAQQNNDDVRKNTNQEDGLIHQESEAQPQTDQAFDNNIKDSVVNLSSFVPQNLPEAPQFTREEYLKTLSERPRRQRKQKTTQLEQQQQLESHQTDDDSQLERLLNEQPKSEVHQLEQLPSTQHEFEQFHTSTRSGAGLQAVNFTACNDGSPAPLSLVVDCSGRERDTCTLDRGSKHTVRVTFVATQDSSHVVSSLVNWRTWVELPLPEQDRAACNHMPCPVKKGDTITFTYPLNMPSYVMRRRYSLIWRLTDGHTDDRLLCFTFRTHVT